MDKKWIRNETEIGLKMDQKWTRKWIKNGLENG